MTAKANLLTAAPDVMKFWHAASRAAAADGAPALPFAPVVCSKVDQCRR